MEHELKLNLTPFDLECIDDGIEIQTLLEKGDLKVRLTIGKCECDSCKGE